MEDHKENIYKPEYMIREEQRQEKKTIDKACMWIAHGHECYNELKWKYCMYIHDDVIA